MKKFYLNLLKYQSKTVILLWTVLILFAFGNSVFAQTTTVNLTTGSGNWTVPCGVTSITVKVWGAGGAGGAATINPSGGSGGGGGGYSTAIFVVTPGQPIPYSVGLGGIGGNGNGGNGGTTTFFTTLTAAGGSGGGQNMGAIGFGGTADTNGNNGALGSTSTGAAGGSSPNGGAGGVATTITSIGNNGIGPGGGGGGGLRLSAGTSNGGNGADGQITITYTTPDPIITSQPSAPAPNCPGSGNSLYINVTATTSSGPLTYQWRKDGVNLGFTDPYDTVDTNELTINDPGISENGAKLDVVVTNSQGCSVISNFVVLTVNDLPVITVQPTIPPPVCSGTSVTNISVTAPGATTYQWMKNGTVINSGTSAGIYTNFNTATLTITNPTATENNASYTVEISNAAGCKIISSAVALTIGSPPAINTQPVVPTVFCAGAGTTTISVTSSTATTFQWEKTIDSGVTWVPIPAGAPYSGVTTNTLTITNPAFSESGASFRVIVGNALGCKGPSNGVTLILNASPSVPAIVIPNSAVTVCTEDGTTPLNATSSSDKIDWYTAPTGGTLVGTSNSGADFLVSSPTATIYYALARINATGCISPSRTATPSVKSNILPIITAQPAATPAVACDGTGSITISVTATGVPSNGYQWRRNGVNLSNGAPYSGVNSATLTITNPPIGDNAIPFDVVLNNSNSSCPVTSNSVTFTVNVAPSPPTSVTPSNSTILCGSTENITLDATTPAGNTIFWYTQPTGGSSFASGTNFSVSPTSTTTYYAEARNNSTGCNSPTRTATATITVNPIPAVNIEFTERQNDDTYSIATCGHIAASENDIDIYSGNPAGVGATTYNTAVTGATGQWQVSYDNQVNWEDAPGPTSTQPQYKFEPAYTIFESTPGTYHFRLKLTVNGCTGTSDVITLTVNGDPTLSPGSVAGNQSSCPSPYDPALFTETTPPTVATNIPGYNFSYQWQSSINNSTFTNVASNGTAATYDAPSITQTTYYRRIAIYGSAGGGCSAASNTITVSLGVWTPPTVGAITQPNCTTATGSVVLSNLPPSGTWTLERSGTSSFTSTGTGATTTISGLAAGTYTFTVTAAGCASASVPSTSVVINTAPPVPASPTIGAIIQPTCILATGSIPLSNLPSGNWTLTRTGTSSTNLSGSGSSTTITGLAAGTYRFTVTNPAALGGCTSPVTPDVVINVQPPTPTAPVVGTITQPTCAVTTGSVALSGLPVSGTWTLNPGGVTGTGTSTTRSGLATGTYNFTVTSAAGCTSPASANVVINGQPAPPTTPIVGTITQPTCALATGSVALSGLPAGNWTLNPGGITGAGTTTTRSGLAAGTYNFTVIDAASCISVATANVVIDAQPVTPTAPVVGTITQPTCALATASVDLSGLPASGTWTLNPGGVTGTGTTATRSGLTAGTTYNFTVINASGCTSPGSANVVINAQPTIPVTPSLTAGTITCNNVAANWTTIPNVTGYRIDVARDNIFTDIIPAYNNLLLGSGAVTENVTGLASGLTFYIRLRAENSCGPSANSNIITITTGSSPTAFTTALVQPNCVTATGQITINESTVVASDQYSFDDGVTYQASNMKNLLAAGTYKLRIKNTNGCETLATSVVLNPATTTTYSAGTWSNGTPDVLKKAIFASSYTLSADLQACSCEVNDLVTVTVNPGVSLVLENGLDVLGSGSIIFQNSSSLIQTNNVTNTGNITYKRDTTPVSATDYTYWSSPVYPQTLLNVSPTSQSNRFFSWDAVAGTWKTEATGTTMGRGIGYIIRGPVANTTPAVYTASFIGVPNNGSIPVSIAGPGTYNLIGNPYPSALDAEAFLGANSAIDGTIYFWTHNTPITNNVYNANDYASYNAVGGTGTTARAINSGINNSVPSGKIASGQSFFTISNTGGTVTFTNAMRVGPGLNNNSQFYKGTKTKTNSELKKHRVWINLSNTQGAFKQLLIGYVTSATNGLDKRFDGESFDANTFIDFYSINDNKKLSIQGRALPFDIMDQIPLGYRTTIEGTFSINIDQVDGILTALPIFLEDKLTGTITNLKKGAYSFTTAIGTFDDRFVLRYINIPIKITDFPNINFDEIGKKVLVSVKDHHIKINSFDQTIENVTIYDLSRRKLFEKGNINSNEFNVPDFSSTNQFLMVQIRLKNGKIVTDKIIY